MPHLHQVSIGQETAIALARTKFWERMTAREIAAFQLRISELVCPFEVFHRAVEITLGREVFTHQFGDEAEVSRMLQEIRNQ